MDIRANSKNINVLLLAFIFAFVLFVFGALPAKAQEPGDSSAPITPQQFFKLMQKPEEFASWRTRAENIIAKNPKSISGNALMGFIMHRSEGDLPRARFHLNKAKKEALRQAKMRDREAVQFYQLCAFELMMVLGEMDRYTEKLALIDEFSKFFPGNPMMNVEKVWSYMKLDRETEARQALTQAFNSGDPQTRIIAWNCLGALEAELGNIQASYNAFYNLISEVRKSGQKMDATFLRNIGEVCLNLGRYDEAERYYLEATMEPFNEETYTNPYQDLAKLYLNQGRYTESLQSLYSMMEWSRATKPFLFQQSMAENIQITGTFLLEMGYVDEAVDRLRTLVQRPDRRGGTSIDKDQSEAGNLITWQVALIVKDECLKERMSYSRRLTWWKLFWQHILLHFDIKSAGEKAAALMVSNNRITASLRPYAPGSATVEECFRPHIVKLLGPGVCAAALEEIKTKPPETYPLEEPFLQTINGEIAELSGNKKACLKYLENALNTLPKSEVLLRSRTKAKAAKIYDSLGDRPKALQYYQRVLETNPSAIRKVNAAIPVTVSADSNSTTRNFVKMLKKSPRFEIVKNGLPLTVQLSGKNLAASLSGTDGTVIARAKTNLTEDAFTTASGLAQELHRQVFATKINLSQGDMNSLDGSNLSGSTASDHLRDIFEVEPPAHPDKPDMNL